MVVSGHLFLEHISTKLYCVVISIGLEQSSRATIGQRKVHDLGIQGRIHSVKRKWFFTSPSSRLLFHGVRYVSEWWCSSLFFMSLSLRWCLSNHLNAVLLELRSEQSVLILQLLNLKNKDPKKKKISLSTSSSPWQLNIDPGLQTNFFHLKTGSAGWM